MAAELFLKNYSGSWQASAFSFPCSTWYALATRCFASFYVTCRWKSTPHATWLASYAFFSAGLFMGTGLILRYLLGEHFLWDKGMR